MTYDNLYYDGTDPDMDFVRPDLADTSFSAPNGEPIATNREQWRAWLFQRFGRPQMAITLPLRKSRKAMGPRGVHVEILSNQKCGAIAEEFMRRLNQRVLGNAAKRYGHSLEFIACVERGKLEDELHVHIAVSGIPNYAKNWFKTTRRVHKAAAGLGWVRGHADIDVEPNNSTINYLTKTIRQNNADAIIIERCPTSRAAVAETE